MENKTMIGRLVVYLNRVTMLTRKGQEHCVAEFSATLATGTLDALEADAAQLGALPTATAQACRLLIAQRAVTQMALETAGMENAAVFDGDVVRLDWKRTVNLERLRVKKDEDKDHRARARILFVVKLEEKEAWPAKELVGRWLALGVKTESQK